ncbi:MAG: alanine racemase [Ruminococcaceae bacterium]|nr:alanine racemase [Oscillospiraceae bacterium]
MTTQRVRVQIQTRKIQENYLHLKSLVPRECNVLAVVKADAYGHGAVEVCKMLYRTGCRYFAVACIEEALHLRENGIEGNILILGNTDPSYAKQLEEQELIQTVDNAEYASALAARGKVRVHIKVDTGMSRLGLYCHREEDLEPTARAIEGIAALEGLTVEGIFTHFADSDGETEDFTRKQFGLFSSLLDRLNAMGVDVGIRHCCNSAGILRFPEMHLDMVRAGLVLYGLMPSPYVNDPALQPAMKLIARVSAVNTLKPGDAVSYGGVFKAEKEMRVAVLSIGYADGLSRALSGNLTVGINGREVPLIGRICMDLCMADLGDTPCKAGDEAVIFDTPEKIEEMAEKLGTINYEVICSLKKRVYIEYV